jgi:hypothetical protein
MTPQGNQILDIQLATNTFMPPPRLATVTPPPPTATLTPTQGPCEARVQAGEDLITLAFRCGHRSMDVLTEILELNNLSAPEALQVGQLLLIPWPTPTIDPNISSVSPLDEGLGINVADAGMIDEASINPDSSDDAFATSVIRATPTNTLIPGVMWHQVQPNESVVGIAYQYNTTVEVLDDLNPEVTFSQCDYSSDTGGPRCTVILQQGQLMRVPAPSPTPTLSPTPNGSETATATMTPTYNAPSALSPSNRALFLRNDLITLRWTASGILSANEAYYVHVEDITTNTTYAVTTTQLFYIVPTEWQGNDIRRHDYRWTVGVIHTDDPSSPAQYTTEARTFTWEGRGENNG